MKGRITVVTEETKLILPLISAQMDCCLKGAPVTRKEKARPEEPLTADEAATLQDISAGRQTVIAPLRGIKSAKVLPVGPGREDRSLRSASGGDAEAALAKEQQAQVQAAQRAKRVRDEALATAAAKAKPKAAKKAKPAARESTASQDAASSSQGVGADLAFLGGGVDDEEPL